MPALCCACKDCPWNMAVGRETVPNARLNGQDMMREQLQREKLIDQDPSNYLSDRERFVTHPFPSMRSFFCRRGRGEQQSAKCFADFFFFGRQESGTGDLAAQHSCGNRHPTKPAGGYKELPAAWEVRLPCRHRGHQGADEKVTQRAHCTLHPLSFPLFVCLWVVAI